jgi:AhpD family alkylhydroperoxidase
MAEPEHPPYVNIYKAFPAGYEAVAALEQACAGAMDPVLFELVKLRASQINGCAYCVDMHWKDARAAGETEERLYMLSAWREARVYTATERAALALTEEVTLIADGHVPPAVEAAAREHLDEAAYAALVFTIATINTWNRLAITSHAEPGRYRSKAHAASS